MSEALTQWRAKMATLEAEEKKLREMITAINAQKDGGSVSMAAADVDGENDAIDAKAAEQDGKSKSKDESQDAMSEIKEDEVERSMPSSPKTNPETGKAYNHLPVELILQITSYVARGACSQQALATCCLLARPWYDAALPLLYRKPKLYGQNFDPFVRAICPSINLHVRKSPLAELVRVLDMSQLVHQGSKSMTARVLGRTKDRLEEFVAPQATFSIHSFPALRKCARLRTLNLSLVSESPPLPDLFKSISQLTSLTTLRLPRSTGFGVHHSKSSFSDSWPPNLTDLTLSGGIDAHFLHGIVSFPQNLTRLTIEHCPLAKTHAIKHLLNTAIRPLEKLQSLKIAHMPRLSDHALDDILFILPQISHLSISVDYITNAIFDEAHFHHDNPKLSNSSNGVSDSQVVQHLNLRSLELTNSGAVDAAEKIDPLALMMVVAGGGDQSGDNSSDQSGDDEVMMLSKLRLVRVAQSLGWHSARSADHTEALTEALQEGAKEDWEKREWVFAHTSEEKYWRERIWETVSGVWVFEG